MRNLPLLGEVFGMRWQHVFSKFNLRSPAPVCAPAPGVIRPMTEGDE